MNRTLIRYQGWIKSIIDYETLVFLQLFFVLTIRDSCSSQNLKTSVVLSLTLYNQPVESINQLVDTSVHFDSAASKIYTDQQVLSLVNNKQKDNSLFLWKGGIYGKIIYQSGESEIIAVSRYGAYFKNMATGQGYSFKTDRESDEWSKMINDFFDSK